MKKRFMFSLSLIVLFAFTLTAQEPGDFTGSLLWKVTGDDLKTPSYVFGTHHLLGSELMYEVPGLKEAFKTTEQIIGELNLEDTAALQEKIMQAVMLTEDESYKNLLSEEEYLRLDAGLKQLFGAGANQLKTMKPGFIGTQLAIILYMQMNPTFNPATFEGIDSYLQKAARENNKAFLGLETIEDQINVLLNSDSQLKQMQSLLCSIESINFAAEMTKILTAGYRAGNLQKMYTDSFKNEKDPCVQFTISSKDVLLKNRNDKWIEKLPALMKEKSSLIAVGALHLAGADGILYQLHKKGYQVTAVK